MRGRKPAGPAYVDQLQGSPQAKDRAKVVLETMDGTRRVQEACARLNISEPRFHQLRAVMLQAAVQALEPGTAGRPAQAATPEQEQIADLKEQLAFVEAALKGAQVREEIALGLPRAAQAAQADPTTAEPKDRPAAPEKKTRRRPRSRRQRQKKPAES
jgi:hypothetical protein